MRPTPGNAAATPAIAYQRTLMTIGVPATGLLVLGAGQGAFALALAGALLVLSGPVVERLERRIWATPLAMAGGLAVAHVLTRLLTVAATAVAERAGQALPPGGAPTGLLALGAALGFLACALAELDELDDTPS